jgi:ABC-type polysaccharide/polyol phosphate transport system ATPase subunit
MSQTVIKVENLSKQYRLGEIGTGSIAHDINRWWHKVRGKEDPYLKIGETNDRTQVGNSDYVWALKDINFEVQQAEVLGIIGRNGAGKSTLLKILSKTTAPTTGNIKIKGRIASLLEVGTGFHPELSGRDNIYLNGAILGMTKQEIKKKFDEIVDFSGVERYIDTPVKRYSSGMYVRLAFAVAAHLEPEILIVDEVLAVGDAEFQQKCLGKMKDVSVNDGRTVLFVSHNMGAIQKLCTKGIFLLNGEINDCGYIDKIISNYLRHNNIKSAAIEIATESLNQNQEENGFAQKISIEDLEGNLLNSISVGQEWQIRIRFKINKFLEHFIIAIGINTINQINLSTSYSSILKLGNGIYEVIFKNTEILLASGSYSFTLGLSNYEKAFHYIEDILKIEIEDIKDDSIISNDQIIRTKGSGILLNSFPFQLYKLS